MTREEARIYWIGRYEAARKWDDPHWEASERKEHRRYVDALNAAIKALSSAEAVCEDTQTAEKRLQWDCTANFVAEQLDRLRNMTDEERWDFFIKFFSPSAEAVPQSEQYKKGFEDAKRAFLVEYARESENMRKRNAQLEVMLNVQKELSAEAEWIPCSERLPSEDGCYLVSTTGTNNDIIDIAYYTEEIWHKASRIKAWMPLPDPYTEMEP